MHVNIWPLYIKETCIAILLHSYVVVLLCMPEQCDEFIVYNYLLAFLIIIELSIQCMILQISYTNNTVAVVKTLTQNLGNQQLQLQIEYLQLYIEYLYSYIQIAVTTIAILEQQLLIQLHVSYSYMTNSQLNTFAMS